MADSSTIQITIKSKDSSDESSKEEGDLTTGREFKDTPG